MQDFFAAVANVAIAVFAISSMLSVGMANRLREIIEPLRHPRDVARALLVNFVLVPALAFLVTWIIPLDGGVRYGLILVAMAAGAPFLIKLSEAADTSLRLTATLLLLLPVTIIYLPLAVPVLLPGAEVSALAIATPLVLTMLLPLAVGLWTREQWRTLAARLQPIMANVSSVVLVVVVLATMIANLDALAMMGWQAVLAALLIILGAFTTGYLFAGRDPKRREVLGLGTGQRNIAAATVVASQSFGASSTIMTVVLTSLVGLATLFAIAWWLRQRRRERHPQPSPPR